jgi:hypothetical protein
MEGLLFYGEERGSQSAGVYVNGIVVKRAIRPMSLTETSEFFNAFEHNPSIALGHTRQPTCGGRDDAQAQPFKRGDTVSVHNGFFFDMKSLRKTWSIKKPSGVDSELVASFVESYGPNMLPKFLQDTDGPSAIAAVHSGRLYLMRSGNPIVYTRIPLEGGGKITIFASTETILRNAISYVWLRHWVKVSSVPENILFECMPHKLKQRSKPIDGYTYRSFTGGYGYGLSEYLGSKYERGPSMRTEFDKDGHIKSILPINGTAPDDTGVLADDTLTPEEREAWKRHLGDIETWRQHVKENNWPSWRHRAGEGSE